MHVFPLASSVPFQIVLFNFPLIVVVVMDVELLLLLLPCRCSVNEEWKRIRSSASKQVVPRRVGRFVSPMCDIADDFITHLEEIMDEDGNISDIPPEVSKWTFQSKHSH